MTPPPPGRRAIQKGDSKNRPPDSKNAGKTAIQKNHPIQKMEAEAIQKMQPIRTKKTWVDSKRIKSDSKNGDSKNEDPQGEEEEESCCLPFTEGARA